VAALKDVVGSFILCAALVSAQPANSQTTASADVRALAGSGFAGTLNGNGAQARFLMPAALAFAPDGTLYVADAAAQQIRAITREGVVRPVAGSGVVTPGSLSLEGGFRDGPAALAKFAHPAGLAVRRDGAIYVADAFNHCVRLIDRNDVSTIAGRCGVPGFVDGAAADSRFRYPRGLAVCGESEELYIADQRNGVRVLDPAGRVATLSLPVQFNTQFVTGIACVDGQNESYLYVTVKDRIVRYALRSHQLIVAYNVGAPLSMNSVQGGAPLGHAYSLAALSPDTIVYGDLLDGAVRYVEDFAPSSNVAQPHPQYVGATPPEDAPLGIAAGKFSAPMGIAVDRHDGRIAIADALQRKIYVMKLTEGRHAFNPDLPPSAISSGEYRIVIEGNYLLWSGTGFADSIAGLLERRLQRSETAGLHVRVVPLHSPCPDVNWVAHGGVNLVIFLTNSYIADCDGVPRFQHDPLVTQTAGAWQSVAQKTFQPIAARLAGTGVRALNVLMPFAWEVAPNEQLYRTQEIGYPPATTGSGFAFKSDYVSTQRNLARSLEQTGLPLLDLFPIFRTFERRPHSATLYATEDLEPSAAGRELIADALTAYLAKERPWRR